MYMDTDIPVVVLEECEKGLRKAAAAALEGGEYGRARQIMAWAENVAAMLMVARSQSAADKAVPAARTQMGAGEALEAGSVVAGEQGLATGGKARVFAGIGSGSDYPRFMRRGDELVKIAWSKSDQAEYQHRAPRRAVEAVVARLNALGVSGSAFGSEDLSPLKDVKSGGIFPTYQIFVALAWLRKLGLVIQEGRKSGYTIRRDVSLDEEVAKVWGELAPGAS
jgi:hypothetical protein